MPRHASFFLHVGASVDRHRDPLRNGLNRDLYPSRECGNRPRRGDRPCESRVSMSLACHDTIIKSRWTKVKRYLISRLSGSTSDGE